jgi:hypothetical protein
MKLLRRMLARWRGCVELGEARRINSDVVIEFRGQGPAAFRVQHARDEAGVPDELSWCDVSLISDRRLDPARVIDAESMVRGMFVGQLDGDHDAIYRRHRADWIRVLPLEDDDDMEARKRCQAYSIKLFPVTS